MTPFFYFYSRIFACPFYSPGHDTTRHDMPTLVFVLSPISPHVGRKNLYLPYLISDLLICPGT